MPKCHAVCARIARTQVLSSVWNKPLAYAFASIVLAESALGALEPLLAGHLALSFSLTAKQAGLMFTLPHAVCTSVAHRMP